MPLLSRWPLSLLLSRFARPLFAFSQSSGWCPPSDGRRMQVYVEAIQRRSFARLEVGDHADVQWHVEPGLNHVRTCVGTSAHALQRPECTSMDAWTRRCWCKMYTYIGVWRCCTGASSLRTVSVRIVCRSWIRLWSCGLWRAPSPSSSSVFRRTTPRWTLPKRGRIGQAGRQLPTCEGGRWLVG